MSEMRNCKEVPITDVLTFIVDNRGKTVPTSDSGFPLIATNCVLNTHLYPVFDKIRYVSQETLHTWFRAELMPNDILFVNKGTPGRVCLVPDPVSFCAAQDMIGLRANPELVDYRYLLAVLRSPAIQRKIQNYHVGIAIPHFKKEDLKNLCIPLPGMATQRKIGEAYFAISEKIENNNAICAELEAMAKLLYDYWFVQFDYPDENGKPYKSSGGKMVWSEELKREIPEGWNAGNLYNIADFINGLACQKFRPEVGGESLPVIKIGEMHDGITEKTERVRADIPPKNIIQDGDILFSWSATLETMIWTGGVGGLNQHIFKVIPKLCSKHYVYQQLSAYILNFVKMAEARKTTMGHITTDHLKQSKIALPPKNIVALYEERVESIYSMVLTCRQENRNLASLRDFLLPLLMNGQVVIKSDK